MFCACCVSDPLAADARRHAAPIRVNRRRPRLASNNGDKSLTPYLLVLTAQEYFSGSFAGAGRNVTHPDETSRLGRSRTPCRLASLAVLATVPGITSVDPGSRSGRHWSPRPGQRVLHRQRDERDRGDDLPAVPIGRARHFERYVVRRHVCAAEQLFSPNAAEKRRRSSTSRTSRPWNERSPHRRALSTWKR